MTGHRGMHCGFRRFRVADFADENDVGILTENGAQHSGKREAGLFVDLNLGDAIDFVFDGIFDGDDVQRLIPKFVDQGVERCGLCRCPWVRRRREFPATGGSMPEVSLRQGEECPVR